MSRLPVPLLLSTLHPQWLGRTLCLILLFSFFTFRLSAQPATDRKAEQLYQQGVAAFGNRNYTSAQEFFTQVGARPANAKTVPALYLLGLCHYYTQDFTGAISKFHYLVQTHSQSAYVPEANYHKALCMLRSPEASQQEGALFLLLNLAEQSSSEGLRRDAEAAALKFFYETAQLDFLRKYLEKVRPTYKTQVTEALCYRLHMAGRRAEVVKRLGEYEQANGTLTPRLRKLKDRPNTEVARKEELRIAVLLPFHLDSVAFGLPTRGRPAMTFLAGLRLALEHERPFPGFNAVEVDVYDTRGQETRTRQLLDSLATKMPDVVIGDFVAASSRLIGSWCQQKQVLHIVPLSPVASLVDTLQWSFLASPTLETQAAKMAQLVTEKLRMRKVMVITDGSASSTVMADTFIALLNAAQITTLRERVPNFYNYDAVHQKMRANRCDGLYMPVFNQGVVNYAINRMFEDSLPLRILGVYDWQLMEEVDPDLLAHFTLYYHGAFFRDNDSTRSREFESEYRLNYHNRGTREAVVAYDLVHWLLEAYGTYTQALPLNQVLHKMPPYRGIAQNYWFGTAQTNQSVRVLRYRKDGTSEEAAPTTTP